MSGDEIIRVSYDELTPDYNELVELKCLQAFGKTRNKVIMKGSLPKVDEKEYTKTEKRMFEDVIHTVVHQDLINQSGVPMNTIKNVIRSEIIASSVQEQGIDPSYFNTQTPCKKLIVKAETSNAPNATQTSTMTNRQSAGGFDPHIAPAIY